MQKKKWIQIKRILWITVAVLSVVVSGGGYYIYKELFSPNVIVHGGANYLLIPTGSSFEDVVKLLDEKKLLINDNSFQWTAMRMKYVNSVKPGRYLIKPKMNNKELVSLLRSGKQVPVQVVFNNIRTKQQLADRVGAQLEAKPYALLNLMNDEDYVSKLGFTSENILSLFIPDTYEMYWNTSPDQFLQHMKKENEKFWTEDRIRKSREIGFKMAEVSVLASIVQQETNKEDEKSIIAGVYINRIKKGMKLEADPTLVYALGDFSINRVLNVYKEIDSPYNTYKNAGLPPGPICLPTRASIDAVLHYVHHSYIYFCAKEDFSGHHSFATTYDQHCLNARRFQKALDRRGIKS